MVTPSSLRGQKWKALAISADLFEDSELIEPVDQLRAAGVEVDVAAPSKGPITGRHGRIVQAGLSLKDARPADYGLLILPGGKAPAQLRGNPEAIAIARHFLEIDKPVAAICHGPQVLVATGLLAGRRATGYRSIRRELEAAGVNYEDRDVVTDGNLITARQPSDIPAFIAAICRMIGLRDEPDVRARTGKV